MDLHQLAAALSDVVRVRILELLARADGGLTVSDLQDSLALGQSRVSYHLRLLREAGFIREEPRGRWHFYRLEPAGLLHLAGALLALATSAESGTAQAPDRPRDEVEKRPQEEDPLWLL